ncbi:MAG: Rpn family recombination-promoting nuclease/putative transposase [Bacteroidales bacterium]|nr:Rpn family recombination-promoting nuclease/putative transposase [Bacteroidales bacterium]
MSSEGIYERFINFYTDFAFKKFFGTPANKEFLISFLNALLKLEGDEEIKDIKHLNTEKLPIVEADRKAIYDVYCENNKGEKFIVEMQKASQINFIDRSIYYASFPIQEQGEKGYIREMDDKKVYWKYELRKVYVIGVLNFVIDDNPDHTEVVTHAKIRYDEYDKELYSDKLEFINIEMPKFQKSEDELENMLDKWFFAMKNLYHLADRPKALREAIFKRLFNLAEISKYKPNELLAYRDSLKDYRDYYNTIDFAEIKGRKEGREEGRAEGLVEGITKGAQSKAYEIARQMLADGISIDMIAKYTKLSQEEIKKI